MVMEFGLLGDLRVRFDGRPVDIGHARQQSVLAVLLVGANRVVPAGVLVDRVWGEGRLPARPVSALQTYVSLLRRVLATAGATIVRQAGGYQLRVDEETVDVYRFRALIGQARRAGDDRSAAALLEQALGLWRGEPFPSLDTAWLNTTRAALNRERHAAQLDFADVSLRLGRHTTLLVDLVDWVERHPLDERLAGQYMLALYRSGRQADALAHYAQVRRRLAEQLGADPSRALQALYQQILTADAALAAPPQPVGGQPPARLPTPQQLPPDTAHFTGRQADLGRLDAALADGLRDAESVGITLLHGAPGAGKTTLALHWARRVSHLFPDGQLYANLRGFDPGCRPLDPAEVLDGFLRALDVAAGQIPPGLEARVGLYRSLLAGRRMLVFLDNAASVGQVRALLPSSPRSQVVVTSRSWLAGLAVREGLHRVGVAGLPEPDAVALLRGIIGPARAAADPGAVASLARRCGYLPLALRIAAERIAAHPHMTPARLDAELAGVAGRLDALATDDADAGTVRAAFSWSYRALAPDAARMFRLLSLHPGPAASLGAAAALAGLPPVPARRQLDALAAVHLVEETGPDRFGLPGLLRLYAAECAATEEDGPARAAAVRRMLGWYACRAGSATAAWDEVELPNIAAAADAAASCGEDDTARLLRGSVNQSGLPEALACFRYALSVAAPGPPPR